MSLLDHLESLIFDNSPPYLFTVPLVSIFELKWWKFFLWKWPGIYLKKTKRFSSQKPSVLSEMILKNESSRSPRIPNIRQFTHIPFHCSTHFYSWVKMVGFLDGIGQAFISKKQKDLAVKSIPFVLKWYGKMSLLDNLESQPIMARTFHCSTGFNFWGKMVKFFGGNNQAFISKKQKDLSVKSNPFVLKWYGKMSLLDNLYELPWLESRYATI